MENFGLIGYPLGHSMSPFIHRELFAINGINAEYALKEIEPQRLADSLDELKLLRGFNVTIPHKTAIIPMLDALSQRAELFGAVNTVAVKNGRMIGYNTDCIGFLRSMEMADIKLDGSVLVCGSGGVSRMFAFESVLAGAQVTIAVRETGMDCAIRLQNEIADKLKKSVKVIAYDEVEGEYSVLINGTPVGMHPHCDASVLPKEKVKNCAAVFDAIYNPQETLLLKYAEECGAKYSNGLPMLVWQAVAAQEIWFGVEFTAQQVRDVINKTERELNK